jgi:glucosyl-3-phosphoglycerate synthase
LEEKMADFYQNSIFTTLQNLTNRPFGDMSEELLKFARKRKIALLLPALYSEFETEAMGLIIEELKKIPFIETVVLSLDQANKEHIEDVKRRLSMLPQEVKIIWNHGPKIQELYDELLKEDFPLDIPGKGRVVWMGMGYVLSQNKHHVIALHDCDIKNYNKELVGRLVYPLLNKNLNYRFAKGYYARANDKLYGRVKRLFYIPLIRALKKIVGSENHFLCFLDNFRYALSGEFAFVSDLARTIRIAPTWGLEVSILSDVYQTENLNKICQVEIMDTYEHKHNVIDVTKPNHGLLRMATDIAKTTFRVLSQDGISMSEAFYRTLLATYVQEARKAIEQYYALAEINGLNYDRHDEIKSVESYTLAIKNAWEEFIENPIGVRLISPWIRIESALPGFMEKLSDYVREDNE